MPWFTPSRNPLRNAIDFVESQWWPAYARERSRWKSLMRDGNDTRVFYGFDDLPDAIRRIGGGLVKCGDLACHFPNTLSQPNALYLVSSALPRVGSGFAGLFLPDSPVFMTRFARKVGAKVVVNHDGVAYAGWHGPGWRRANIPYRRLVHSADYVFFQSRFSKMSSDRFLGERKGLWEILYNPVDTDIFTPGPLRPEGRPFTLLVAGTHYGFYRVETAVEALSLVRKEGLDCRLKIAGRLWWLPSEEACRRQVMELISDKRLFDWVDEVGPYSQNDAVSLYRSADILIHAKYNDPCPRVVVEAMACGLPVVYSATGGTPELVGDEAGVGIPAPLDWEREHPPTGSQLAEAIVKIIKNYKAFSDVARRRAITHFDLKPWIERHREIFFKLHSEKE